MITDGDLEYLVKSARDGALAEIFDTLERDTFEELVRMPFWASRKRMAGLVERVRVVRDVRQRIRLLKATRSTEKVRVV